MEDKKPKLEDITIEYLIDNIFVKNSIKKKKKDIVDYCIQKFGKNLFGMEGDVSDEAIANKVTEVLKEDRKRDNPNLTYSKQFYSKAKNKGKTINPIDIPDTNYIGKGGECLVMGELLLRGYNVNNMMVDEGIDLVATKNNVFFYIQVKTTIVTDANKFYFRIAANRYDAFLGTQIRYVLTARCKISNEVRTVYFTFDNKDIDRFVRGQLIPQPAKEGDYSIKIEYDTKTGNPYIYDGNRREDVSYYMNKFDL